MGRGAFGEGAAPRAGNFKRSSGTMPGIQVTSLKKKKNEKEEKPTNFNIKMCLKHGKRG